MSAYPHSSAASFSASPAAALARARGVIEGKFLELGKVLELSVEAVNRQIGALDELVGVFAAGTIDDATANLSNAAAGLNGAAQGRGDDRARFHAMAEASRLLHAQIEGMLQALRYLHVFAVNIKVTAGGVPGAYEVFEDFAEEVLGAIDAGRSQMTEFGRDLQGLAREVDAAVAHESDLEHRCAELLPAVPRELTGHAETLANHHKQIAAAAAEAGATARSLQAKVGNALCGLQIGDTTRQRVEHAEAALVIAARAEADSGLSAEDAAIVRAMVAAQLQDTAEIFNRDVDQMAQNLGGVARDADRVLRLRDAARGGGRGDKAGVLARLEVSLAHAISLVHDLEAAELTAGQVGRSAQATAAGLARRIDTIRKIKGSINQMALNAHLKCCRLGDPGRPLSVIAVELRVSADDLGDAAQKTEAILTRLAEPPAVEAGGADAASARAVGALLEAAVGPIRLAESKTGSDLMALGDQCEAMIGALQQATRRLDFQGEVSEVLIRVAQDLEEGAPAPSAPVSAAFEATMAEISKLYTMARERQIHRGFLPASEDSAAAA